MIKLNCNCDISYPCSLYTLISKLVYHAGMDIEVDIKSCILKESHGDIETKHDLYLKIISDIKDSINTEVALIKKFKQNGDVAICSVLQRLMLSLDIALLAGQKQGIQDLKVTAQSFNSLSNVVNEMSKSLGDDKTPGEYDQQEWEDFNQQYKQLMHDLVYLFESQERKRIK